MRDTWYGRIAETALFLAVFGCTGYARMDGRLDEKPEIPLPCERLHRLTYETNMRCGMSSWDPKGRALLFTKEPAYLPGKKGKKREVERERMEILRNLGIWEVNVDTLQQKHRLRNFGAIGNVQWMPDGRGCLYQWGAGHIAVTDLTKSQDYDVIKSGSIHFGSACFTPHGNRVGYMATSKQHVATGKPVAVARIETCLLDGTDRRVLYEQDRGDVSPLANAGLCFSGPGDRLFFVASTSGGSVGIYSVGLADGEVKLVVKVGHVEGVALVNPRSTPDGKWVAFTMLTSSETSDAITSGAWMVGTDGGSLRELVKGGGLPNWAPDGRTFAFVYGKDLWSCRLSQEAFAHGAQGASSMQPAVSERPDDRLRAALRWASNGEYVKAIAECERIRGDAPDASVVPRALLLEGQWRRALGKTQEASECFELVLERFRYTEEAVYSLKALEMLHGEGGESFPFEERLASLMDQYAIMAQRGVSEEDVAKGSYLTGICWDMEVRGELGKALEIYLDVMKSHPRSIYAHRAGLRAAKCYVTMGRQKDGLKRLYWIARHAAQSEEATEARVQILTIEVERGQLGPALDEWHRLQRDHQPLRQYWIYSRLHHSLIVLATLACAEEKTDVAIQILDHCLANPPVDLGDKDLEERNALIGQILLKCSSGGNNVGMSPKAQGGDGGRRTAATKSRGPRTRVKQKKVKSERKFMKKQRKKRR